MKRKIISTKMKVTMVITFILFFGCYLAGSIVLYNSNYKLSDYFNDWEWFDDWDFEWEWDWGSNRYKYSIDESQTFDLDESVNKLSINSTSIDVNICKSNESSIKLALNGSCSKNINIGNIISTTSSSDSISISTNENRINHHNLVLTVYVPSSYSGDLSINTTSGDIDLNNTTLAKVNINSTSGDIECIDTINNDYTKIETTSGEINFAGSLKDSTITSTSGDIELSVYEVGKNTNVSTTSGDIDLYLKKDIGYEINFNTTSGDFDYTNEDEHNYRNSNGNYTVSNGNKEHLLNIETVSGDFSFN